MEQLELFTEQEESDEKSELLALPYFPEAKNDNEKLLNYQYELYRKDKQKALTKMYALSLTICRRMVNQYMQSKKIYFSDADEKAHDAAMYVLTRFMQPNSSYVIRKSFIAALHHAVLYILCHRRKVDLIVDFVDPVTLTNC